MSASRGLRGSRAVAAWAVLLAGCSPGGSHAVAASGGGLSAGPAADDPIAFGAVPIFALTSQTGEPVTDEDLRGRPYVMAAVFTTCIGPCPRVAREMKGLQADLEGTDALLVSVSVDPSHDSPEVLAEYAAELGADPARWLFLTGDEARVDALVREGFKLGVARSTAEDVVPGRQVTHGTKLVAVDRHGRIRGWYESQSDAGVQALRARMQHLASEP